LWQGTLLTTWDATIEPAVDGPGASASIFDNFST
jgi:hypothetical protein